MRNVACAAFLSRGDETVDVSAERRPPEQSVFLVASVLHCLSLSHVVSRLTEVSTLAPVPLLGRLPQVPATFLAAHISGVGRSWFAAPRSQVILGSPFPALGWLLSYAHAVPFGAVFPAGARHRSYKFSLAGVLFSSCAVNAALRPSGSEAKSQAQCLKQLKALRLHMPVTDPWGPIAVVSARWNGVRR